MSIISENMTDIINSIIKSNKNKIGLTMEYNFNMLFVSITKNNIKYSTGPRGNPTELRGCVHTHEYCFIFYFDTDNNFNYILNDGNNNNCITFLKKRPINKLGPYINKIYQKIMNKI